jgi:hypothetical protein
LIAAAPQLIEACEKAERWMSDPNGDKLEEWERIAHEFHLETGELRPGKSYPLGMPVPENLDEIWRDWCNKKQSEVLASLRAALQATAEVQE